MIPDNEPIMLSRKSRNPPRCRWSKRFPAGRRKIIKLSVALGLCFFSAIAAASPITGNDAKVVLCMAPPSRGHEIFNPTRIYGNPVRYMKSDQVLVVIIGKSIFELDVDQAVEEAMAEWTAAVPSLRFQAVPKGQENQATWKIQINGAETTRLGSGHGTGAQSTEFNPRLTFFAKGFGKAAEQFGANAPYMESPRLADYLAFLMRFVAKHEVGHLLGFMHSPGVGAAEDEKDANGCVISVVFTPTNLTAGPPIMAPNVPTALRLMTHHFGRRLRVTDIQIAPQEAAVARAVFEQNCPVNVESLSDTPSNGAQSSCPPVTQVMSHEMPGSNELLLQD